MPWNLELLTTEFILFFSAGIFPYWIKRALLILAESDEEISRVLESDLWWGRRFWLTLRILLNPSGELLPL